MLIIWALLLFGFLVNQGKLKQTKRAALLIFLASTFVMGWRSVTYTGDVYAYAGFFKLNSHLSLAESWNAVIGGKGKDPFFHFLGNVMSKCGFTYRGWFVFLSALFMGGFCFLMYKRSQNFFLSLFFLVTLGSFHFAMTGIRQAVAMGFCYAAFEFLCRRKMIIFAILVAIGGLFHSSGWVFFLMYPLSFIPFGKKYFLFVFIAPLIALLFPRFLGSMVHAVAWNKHMEAYADVTSGLTISGYIIELAIFLFGIWCIAHRTYRPDKSGSIASGSVYDLKNEPVIFYGMAALGIGCALRAFAINIDNFFRIALYFSCLAPLIIPSLLNKLSRRDRETATLIIMVICFAKTFWDGGHYAYFSLFEELR